MYTINLYDHFFAQLNLYVHYCNFYIIIIKIIIKIYMYDVVNLYYLMSTNKSISYVLCNKGIIINLYKLHFSSFPFFLQPNKKVFHLPTFPPLQPNTQEGKPNIFYPPTFPSSHNFTFSTKRSLRENAIESHMRSITMYSQCIQYDSCGKNYGNLYATGQNYLIGNSIGKDFDG